MNGEVPQICWGYLPGLGPIVLFYVSTRVFRHGRPFFTSTTTATTRFHASTCVFQHRRPFFTTTATYFTRQHTFFAMAAPFSPPPPPISRVNTRFSPRPPLFHHHYDRHHPFSHVNRRFSHCCPFFHHHHLFFTTTSLFTTTITCFISSFFHLVY